MRDRTIVALDTDAHTALAIARELAGKVDYVKVGMTLYYAEGPGIVTRFVDMGFKVFVDLKLHDIPHQVEGAAAAVARTGASMMTVHAAGGVEMMEAAVRGACEGANECDADSPDVLAVTVLTSMDDEGLRSVGVASSAAQHVELLGMRAREAGVQGVVCSPLEASVMRAVLGPEALVVTPGVRPEWAAHGDQARVATPAQAIESGASHVVIGRPVTGADSPAAALERIVGDEDGE
jgi:orotidine-5'-phosphate decarboxylase